MTWVERLGIWVFSRLVRDGSVELTLPRNRTLVIGKGLPRADIELVDYSALADVIKKGLIGFAEGYMGGTIKSSDLQGLLSWGVQNQRSWFQHPLTSITRPLRRIWQRIRPERRHPRVQTMNDHYNLGNDFYSAWLDETMTYSSARFANPRQSLAEAQRNKYRTIADHVGLAPGMEVLEIGCGWGGFAEYAAERGCRVTAITLSEEQADFAKKRIADKGLQDQVEIRIEDFREIEGEYDAIVSIEMIESVDETHWAPLFATMAAHLKPGGRIGMQIITIADSEWERYRSRADFIQQYIFPGGQLPAPKVLTRLATASGLEVQQVETFGLDYARTLDHWRSRFESAWSQLRIDSHLDARFHRMWELYLSLCAAGFRTGRIDVEQWAFAPLPAPPSLSA